LIVYKEKRSLLYEFPYQLKLIAVIYMKVIVVLKDLSYLTRMETPKGEPWLSCLCDHGVMCASPGNNLL
jgi:hypothetical protein